MYCRRAGERPFRADEQRGGGESMTQVETKVFDSQTLGRRILRKKVLGRMPALPLAVILIAAGFAAAALYALGPPSAPTAVEMREMNSGGLPSGDILYGAKVNQVPVFFNITIASNTYTAAYQTYVVLTVTASGANGPFNVLADCAANMRVYNIAPPPSGPYTEITATFGGGVCTYTGTVTQNVPIGSTTQRWPFEIIYQAAGTAGPTLTWTSQFWTSA